MANNSPADYDNFVILKNIGNELEKLTSRLNLIHTVMVFVCLGVAVVFLVQAGFALYYLTKIKRRPDMPTELIIKGEDKKKRRSKKKGGSRKSSKSGRSKSSKSGRSGRSHSRRSGKSEKSEGSSADSGRLFPSKEAKIQIDFEKEPEKKKKDLEVPPSIEVAAMPPPAYQPKVDPVTLPRELKQKLITGAAPNYPAPNSSADVKSVEKPSGDVHSAITATSGTNMAVAPAKSPSTTAIVPTTPPLKTATEPMSPLPVSDTKTAVSTLNTQTAVGSPNTKTAVSTPNTKTAVSTPNTQTAIGSPNTKTAVSTLNTPTAIGSPNTKTAVSTSITKTAVGPSTPIQNAK